MATSLKHVLRTQVFVFIIFLVLPYLFFAIDVNILKFALAPGDGIVQGVPTKIYSARLEIWNQYGQSGTFPFKDIGWQSSYLPGILVMKLFPNPFGYNLLLLFHYSIAGFFTFLFLRRLRIEKVAAFIGGLIFMFCGFLTAHKGHHTMMMAAAYLPIILYLVESFLSTGRRSWLFLAAFGFGLSILADYTAVSMYIGMVSFPYILFRVMSGIEFKGLSILKKIFSIIIYSLVVYLGGMLLAAVEVLPILESLQYVTRQQISFDFFTSYSFPLRLLPSLLFPYIYGATSASFYKIPYFGPWNLSELGGYMGILPLLFVVLCFILFRKRDRQVYFWTVVLLLAFLLALGDSTPFYQVLYRVPVYNLFRAPARNWLEGNFAAAVLSSFFIHYVITDSTLLKKNYYQIVHVAITALIGVIFSILAFGKFLLQPSESLPLWLENTRLTSPAIYVPLIIITTSIILVYLLFQNRQNKNYWALVGVVIFVDLFSFGHFHDTSYLSFKIFQKQPNSVAEFLDAANSDRKSYRILPLNMTDYENQLYPSINLLYGFSAVNAYSPIWLKNYTALTGFGADGSVDKHRILFNSSVLSALSTKYIITNNPGDKAFLQNISQNDGPDSDEIIVDTFNDKSWTFMGPAPHKNGSISLGVQDSTPVGMVQYAFTPSPKTTYKITFSARIHKNKIANDVLAIDFYGENYDLPEQNTYINPSEMSSDFRKFTVYLYSGENPPASAFLRFLTYSTFPYEIKDIQFAQAGRYTFWSQKPSSGESFPLYEKKYESPEGIAIYENTNFIPRARFVKELIPISDSSAAIYELRYNDKVDLLDAAFVEGLDFPDNLDEGQIIHADYSKGSVLTLSVRSGEHSFLVLADSWYPGWKAFVDGKETQIYKTNAVSRGVLIEGTGEHQVEFRFIPMSLYIGLGITIATTLAIMITIFLNHSPFGDRNQAANYDSAKQARSSDR